ncbi:quinon protein alcohol dehydrogenase-like superfamily [Gaertneriomyces semiglobifer]|nr:quinon protein alcohol dehydrogenase-like superfamily [Gaertneriomyces semiglobifer]
MDIKATSTVVYPHSTAYSSSQYLASDDETATSPPAPPPLPVKYGAGGTENVYETIIDGPLETYIEVGPPRKPAWIKIWIACTIGIATALGIFFIVRSTTRGSRGGSNDGGGDLDIGRVPSNTNYLRKFYVGAKADVKRVILSPDHSYLFAYTDDPKVPIQQFSLLGPENAVRAYPTPDTKASSHGYGRETAIGLGDQGQSLYRSHDIVQYPAVEGHLLKYNSATGDLIWNATFPDIIHSVFPGGGRGLDDPNTVLVMTPQNLYQLDAQTGAYRASVRFPAARDTTYPTPALVTPDGKSAWIVHAGNSYVMVKYDISNMTPGPIVDVKPAGKTVPLKYASISAVGVAPDSQHVFLATSNNAVVKFSATSSESEVGASETYGMNGYMRGVAVHPCNCLLAGVSEGSAVLYDLRRGRALVKLDTGTQLELSSVDFSADGKMLAMGDEQGWIWLWELQQGWYA